MKTTSIALLAAAGLTACAPSESPSQADAAPATAVTLTHVSLGNIANDIVLSATTVYMDKAMATAPVPSYIRKVRVRAGDAVRSGQALFDLESKEQRALAPDSIMPITVRSGQDGIVLEVLQQEGSYVTEGTTLCTIAARNSLAFLLSVPFEQSCHALPGSACTLVLPDGSRLAATVEKPLATSNVQSQSQQIIVKAPAPFLPEGMNVKALIPATYSKRKQMVLPKSAVLSDETMRHHWVMKLVNDSTAVRVFVETGNSNADSIEVRGLLNAEDRIVETGGNAMADSCKVTITRNQGPDSQE